MYTEYQSHGPEDGLTEWTMLCGPQGKLCKICSPRLSPRLQFPRFPRFPQFPVASVESVSRSTSRTSRETLAKPELNIAKFPKAKRRPKGSRSLLTLSTCESGGYEGYEGYEGHEGCQRCEGESGPSGPSGPSGVRPHRQVGASKLGWRARTRAAQYCHGFFNGAGKVHISQSDCKAEITARLEFKASWRGLVIFLCFTHIELVFLLQLKVETMCARVSAITFKHPAGLEKKKKKCSVFDSFCPVTEVFVVLLAKSNDWFGGYVGIASANCSIPAHGFSI